MEVTEHLCASLQPPGKERVRSLHLPALFLWLILQEAVSLVLHGAQLCSAPAHCSADENLNGILGPFLATSVAVLSVWKAPARFCPPRTLKTTTPACPHLSFNMYLSTGLGPEHLGWGV